MDTDFNITIIGAGVVGLAMAAELSKTYSDIVVIEQNSKFGQETSSRNSEVIHSGIYYPKGSLKAKLCVEGKKLVYAYCDEKDILYNKCGKLIVASSKEESLVLDKILVQAHHNGALDGYKINKEEIKELEPNIRAEAALYFPSTGIVDSHGLMHQLMVDAINRSVEFAYQSRVKGITKEDTSYKITVEEQDGAYTFTSKYVINAAGLNSDLVSQMMGIDNPLYELHYWKGEYFAVSNGKNKMINRLIYPVPHAHNAGLGVHATLDLSGGMKLGPNAIYLEDKEPDYSVSPDHKEGFYRSASIFMPFLEIEDLHQDQAGVRPKLQKPGDPVRDFIIQEESDKGYAGFVNLIGIESPGLTASLAIAKYVSSLLNTTSI